MRLRILLFAAVAACALAAGPASLASDGRNPQTAGLQVALRAQGLYRGPIDAISGPATVAAVRAFQHSQGLPVTGLADARTRQALGPLGRPLFGARSLHHGAFGWDVAVLQFLLVRQGFNVPVNAYFDGPTLHGVRLMQERLHLRHDGVVGPHTLRRHRPARPHAARAAGPRRSPQAQVAPHAPRADGRPRRPRRRVALLDRAALRHDCREARAGEPSRSVPLPLGRDAPPGPARAARDRRNASPFAPRASPRSAVCSTTGPRTTG